MQLVSKSKIYIVYICSMFIQYYLALLILTYIGRNPDPDAILFEPEPKTLVDSFANSTTDIPDSTYITNIMMYLIIISISFMLGVLSCKYYLLHIFTPLNGVNSTISGNTVNYMPINGTDAVDIEQVPFSKSYN